MSVQVFPAVMEDLEWYSCRNHLPPFTQQVCN